MKILIVAPVPPPLTGNSLPVLRLIESLNLVCEIKVINLSKNENKSFLSNVVRGFFLLSVFIKIFLKQKKFDKVYLSVSESIGGNIRDLIIYFICKKRLDSFFIHMFGGTAMKNILQPSNSLIFGLNKYFLSKISGVFVEGDFQRNIFMNVVNKDRIFVVPNFADDSLFASEEEVELKFSKIIKLRILFLSNMLFGKGHIELIDSYLTLEKEDQDKIEIFFVGNLINQKKIFLEKIKNQLNIKYCGPLYDSDKFNIFKSAHVFCLPTYYPYEGQPFSIIEAYASGNAVITTNHGGISHIFKDGVNGYEVKKKSIENLSSILKKSLKQPNDLKIFALNNIISAKKNYTKSKYIEFMKSKLTSV